MRIGFAGTPGFAATILIALLDAGIPLELVLTQPSRPAGRGRNLRPSPVAEVAQRAAIPIATPSHLRGLESLVSDLQVLVVAAYGLILPAAFLSAPKHGCINVHASLLPRWRGASPIEHAILHGDRRTGISIMQIVKELDSGPLYRQEALAINDRDTCATLTNSLAEIGARLMVDTLTQLARGELVVPRMQDDDSATYAPQLQTSDALIDWQSTAHRIERQVRAFRGRSSAFATMGDVRIRILEAQVVEGDFLPGKLTQTIDGLVIGCGAEGLQPLRVQLNRGRGTPLTIKDAQNGYPDVFEPGLAFDFE